jgi:hypothetical protein
MGYYWDKQPRRTCFDQAVKGKGPWRRVEIGRCQGPHARRIARTREAEEDWGR